MANWAQFGHFHLGVYLHLLTAVSTLMGVCQVILWEREINGAVQTVHRIIGAASVILSAWLHENTIEYVYKCERLK